MRNKMTKIMNKVVCMSALLFVFHQSKMPENVKKLRRF